MAVVTVTAKATDTHPHHIPLRPIPRRVVVEAVVVEAVALVRPHARDGLRVRQFFTRLSRSKSSNRCAKTSRSKRLSIDGITSSVMHGMIAKTLQRSCTICSTSAA